MLRWSLGFLALGALAMALFTGDAPAAPPVPTRGDAYIGAGRCSSCHAEAFATWQQKDPHAKAHLSLPAERRNDSKCTVCHSPDPGGVFAGVQCESCHGSGGSYSFTFIMKDRYLAKALGLADANEQRCLSCHRGHGGRKAFDYQTKLRAIVHWADR